MGHNSGCRVTLGGFSASWVCQESVDLRRASESGPGVKAMYPKGSSELMRRISLFSAHALAVAALAAVVGTAPASARAVSAEPVVVPARSASVPFGFADRPARSVPKRLVPDVAPHFVTDALVFENLNNSRVNWVPCLDADSSGIGSNGDLVHIWGCNSTSYQHWKFRAVPGMTYWYTVYNVAGNKCLDADSAGGGRNGNRVQLWSCNGTAYQQWYVWSPDGGDTIYLQNGHGLRYLDAATETAGQNNGRVQLWDWNGGRADEQWRTPAP